MAVTKIMIISVFQSALPRGERHLGYYVRYGHIAISIRAPARGATAVNQRLEINILISIRAPARGATHRHRAVLIKLIISIRAPARGATDYGITGHSTKKNFNPRSREGSDGTSIISLPSDYISIRAPARGATYKRRLHRQPE